MNIVCTNKIKPYKSITVGKIYKVVTSFSDTNSDSVYYYFIINDFGNESGYPSELFMEVSEYRESQISKII